MNTPSNHASAADTGELGSQRKEENRNRAIKRRQARLAEALRWIVGDERGRLYLAEIVRESRALERVQCPSADLVLFVDGQRSMGFKVLNDVRALDDAREPRHFSALCASALTPPKEDSHDD
ncbi:MAG TPA: hypothetical protein VFB13_02035 [Reyranella sp.]|jgi:hypothetical protein|nr:hypothetical protein [Reyranella sp.]